MIQYFKFRKPFDFKPDKFELGNPIKPNKKAANNFFFKKLFDLPPTEFESFYSFHLNWFLLDNPNCEKDFYIHIKEAVEDRIEYYRRQDLFSKIESNISSLNTLRKFKSTIHKFDKWNINKSLEAIIAEKDLHISSLNNEIIYLKDKVKAISRFEPDQKVRILDGKLPVLIDLLKQIQLLEMPDGKKLAKSQSQSPWYKMIARYFQQGDNEIAIETVRNYFPATKEVKLIKGSEVPESQKIFKISRIV